MSQVVEEILTNACTCDLGILSLSPVKEENKRCIIRAQFNAAGASRGTSGARYFNVS